MLFVLHTLLMDQLYGTCVARNAIELIWPKLEFVSTFTAPMNNVIRGGQGVIQIVSTVNRVYKYIIIRDGLLSPRILNEIGCNFDSPYLLKFFSSKILISSAIPEAVKNEFLKLENNTRLVSPSEWESALVLRIESEYCNGGDLIHFLNSMQSGTKPITLDVCLRTSSFFLPFLLLLRI